MATYGGIDIFIRPFTTTHQANPSAQQLSEFFGTSGQQSLWGGWRGRVIAISGMLCAPDPYTLNSYESVWNGQGTGVVGDGIARPLVDTRGRLWLECLCESFQQDGQVRIDGTYGYNFRYRSVFRSLL